MKKLTILIISLGLAVGVKAQSELTLPFMSDVFQSSYINPTVLPEHTFSLGLPGVSSMYGQFISNGFLPKNIIDFKNDTAHIVPDKLLAELTDKNLLLAYTSLDIFHLRLKIRNGYYWFGVRNNFNVSFQYPKDFLSLALEGNKSFIGKNLDLTNLNLDATLYNEYSFGMALEYNRWVFGGRISLLQGLSNVQFNPENLTIQVDSSMYGHTMNANARLNMAGIPMNGAGDPNFDHAQELDYITNYLSNFKNKGVALSVGATYKLTDRIKFSASFYDLGFISWKDSVTNYNLKGQSEFSGLDILQSYLNGSDIETDTIIDSILDDFDRDTIHQAYKTYLKPKFNVSVSYNLFRRTILGFSASGVYNKKLYPAFTLGISQGLGRFLNLIANISYNQKTFNNLGVGLVIKPGPFQFYVIADNVYPAINPLYTTNGNIRVGMNIVFGRVKPAVGLPYR
ncbi:MAG: hypothetical protein EHM93_16540 [Bacteroidales bacterium]|nr:MAG: hypothetical protein EHM93_16540 [Bacteroidales bacterium]